MARINELELMLEELNKQKTETQVDSAELQAEIDRLRVFEENQLSFEERQLEFDKNVIFNEKAPELDDYKSYYEDINPANAEILYRQVVEQMQFSASIKEKAEIYKNMDPSAAAGILETMSADIEAVSQILLSMKAKESAAIMAEMDSVFAAKVTNKMLDLGEEKLSN
ncbi:MAG: hypothetical protein GX915_06385 [Clostridiales bacterium]|nr:hypothetical protein [Clostridiales bacterium]